MLWYPVATRHELNNSGAYTGGDPKLLWHTIEGFYRGPSTYSGTQPHFSVKVKDRQVFQHIPINRTAMALKHPDGTGQTNHDNVVQVELEAFTFRSPDNEYPKYEIRNFTKDDYKFIAQLARWIEREHKVPRQASISFSHPIRMSWNAWHGYAGHCGHVHCPYNDHVDATGLNISQLLSYGPGALTWPTIRRGSTGEAVHHLQVLLRVIGADITVDGVFGKATTHQVRLFQRAHKLEVDGVVGRRTWSALSKAFKEKRK